MEWVAIHLIEAIEGDETADTGEITSEGRIIMEWNQRG